MTTLEGTTTRRGTASRRRWQLPRRARKLVVVLHVASSVVWLGLSVSNLVFALTGLTTTDPTTQHAAYLGAALVSHALAVPLSLAALTSGVALALFTPWGLFRHWWVIVKLVLTCVAVVLVPVLLLPGLHDTAGFVTSTPPDQLADVGRGGVNLLTAACVSSTMYLTCVVLSVFKPGRRRR